MLNSILPEKIYTLCSAPDQELKKNVFAVPDGMMLIDEQGVNIVCIWTNKKVNSEFLRKHIEGKNPRWVELDRDDFIFNLLMFSEEYKYFVVNPIFSREKYECFTCDYHPKYEGNLFPLDDPIIFRGLIADKLKQLGASNNCIREIISQISVVLFLKKDLYDIYIKECKSEKQKRNGQSDQLTKKEVLDLVSSWERRHDVWVENHLAHILQSQFSTMSEIKDDLKNRLMSDWRASLGFFLDRTTYQSRKDVINQKTANYLFEAAMRLPDKFSINTLDKFSDRIYNDKISGRATHLRIPIDTDRVDSICRFISHGREKNFTKIVLEKAKHEKGCIDFLKTFDRVGDKTANFYMKFIAWVFDLDFIAVTIDRHVYTSLLDYNFISEMNYSSAVEAIRNLSKKMNLSPATIETALYEKSWQDSNTP